MDEKKTTLKSSSNNLAPVVMVGLGAFNLIDIEQYYQYPLCLRNLVDRNQTTMKQHSSNNWYNIESLQNKLKILQIYQMAVQFEDKKQQRLEEGLHELIAGVKNHKKVIIEKQLYKDHEIDQLKVQAHELRSRQLKLMKKKYQFYHKQLYPNNPMHVIRNQFLINDSEGGVGIDSKGDLIFAPNNQPNGNATNHQRGQGQRRGVRRQDSISTKKDEVFDMIHNETHNHFNPYEAKQHFPKRADSIEYNSQNFPSLPESIHRNQDLLKLSDAGVSLSLSKNTSQDGQHKQFNYEIRVVSNSIKEESGQKDNFHKMKQIDSKTLSQKRGDKNILNIKEQIKKQQIKPTKSFIKEQAEEEIHKSSVCRPSISLPKVFDGKGLRESFQEKKQQQNNQEEDHEQEKNPSGVTDKNSSLRLGTPGKKKPENNFRVSRRPNTAEKNAGVQVFQNKFIQNHKKIRGHFYEK